MSVCSLRIACNTRRKGASGEWEDKPNYFDVTVWGAQGENCARYLAKGRPVAIDGRLEWREFETREGQRRQAIDIIADSVQFLGGRDDAGAGNGFSGPRRERSGRRGRPDRRPGLPVRTGRTRVHRRRRHPVLGLTDDFNEVRPSGKAAQAPHEAA